MKHIKFDMHDRSTWPRKDETVLFFLKSNEEIEHYGYGLAYVGYRNEHDSFILFSPYEFWYVNENFIDYWSCIDYPST